MPFFLIFCISTLIESILAQLLLHLPCVVVRFLGDRQYDSLIGREPVRELVSVKVRIPSYPKNVETSESLNVSIATGIILAYLRHM